MTEVSDGAGTSQGVFDLADRDLAILVTCCVLTFLVLALAAAAILDAHLYFFGDRPTEREEALADRSIVVIVWAGATPVWAWGLLRGYSEAFWIAMLWVVLFLVCTPWWWPPAPSDSLDASNVPVWYGEWSIFPWALLAAGLGTAILTARRVGQRALLIGAVMISICMTSVGGLSYLNLVQHARAEQVVTTPEASAELSALTADPLWAALPAGPRENEIQQARYTDHDGTEYPTMKMMHIGSTGDFALFQQAVSVAINAGWTLHGSLCVDTLTEATFTKELATGTSSLRVAMASYDPGIAIYATVQPPGTIAQPVLCWEQGPG